MGTTRFNRNKWDFARLSHPRTKFIAPHSPNGSRNVPRVLLALLVAGLTLLLGPHGNIAQYTARIEWGQSVPRQNWIHLVNGSLFALILWFSLRRPHLTAWHWIALVLAVFGSITALTLYLNYPGWWWTIPASIAAVCFSIFTKPFFPKLDYPYNWLIGVAGSMWILSGIARAVNSPEWILLLAGSLATGILVYVVVHAADAKWPSDNEKFGASRWITAAATAILVARAFFELLAPRDLQAQLHEPLSNIGDFIGLINSLAIAAAASAIINQLGDSRDRLDVEEKLEVKLLRQKLSFSPFSDRRIILRGSEVIGRHALVNDFSVLEIWLLEEGRDDPTKRFDQTKIMALINQRMSSHADCMVIVTKTRSGADNRTRQFVAYAPLEVFIEGLGEKLVSALEKADTNEIWRLLPFEAVRSHNSRETALRSIGKNQLDKVLVLDRDDGYLGICCLMDHIIKPVFGVHDLSPSSQEVAIQH